MSSTFACVTTRRNHSSPPAQPKQKQKPKQRPYQSQPSAVATTETIVFDPHARAEYLRGFTQRKQDRRAFGLAMQKVKDRKLRLDARKELREATEEQQPQHSQHSQPLQNDQEEEKEKVNGKKNAVQMLSLYQDERTEATWGGHVIVTTSSRIPGYNDDDIENEQQHPSRTASATAKVDVEQANAGRVEKYLHQIKAKMPHKRNKKYYKKAGLHGASNMKGLNGTTSSDLKLAKKTLDRSHAKLLKKRSNRLDQTQQGKGGYSNRRRKR